MCNWFDSGLGHQPFAYISPMRGDRGMHDLVAVQKVLQAGTVLSSPGPGAPASATRGSLVLTSWPFPAKVGGQLGIVTLPTWADEVFGTGSANPIPVTVTSKAQIEAKIVTPKSFALIGWDQATYRLDEQSHVKAPSRVCDLRRLKTCKIRDRRRQFILRRHGSALNKNRNNRDVASQGRLNFKPHPILRRV